MTVLLESVIEQRVYAWASAHGWYPKKMATPGRRGTADHYFHGFGRIVVVEFKRPGERPRGSQSEEHAKLMRHGIRVYVIDSVEQGIALLRNLGGTQ